MPVPETPRGGDVPLAADGAARPRRPRRRSYRVDSTPVNGGRTPQRTSWPDLSPNPSATRPPVVGSDLALWPAWTDVAVERLDLSLFNDDGSLVRPGGGD